MRYDDIYVVEDFDEAEQFRYEHNDKPVEVGTPVAYEHLNRGAVFNGHPDRPVKDEMVLTCFDGIYFQSDE
jgi:hypothetical protein